MLNFVICDDEKSFVDRLSILLESAFIKGDFDGHIAYKCTTSDELLSYASTNNVDVFILDIQFKNSHISGLDIAEQIRATNKKSYIIFNISLEDAKEIALSFGQESFFYGEVSSDKSIISYYETSDACKTYKLIEKSGL